MTNYILMVQLDVPDEHVDEFNVRYDRDHVPYLLKVDGVVSAQRYVLDGDSEDQLRFLAIYELERPDIPQSEEWQKAASVPAWVEMRDNITARRRGIFRKI